MRSIYIEALTALVATYVLTTSVAQSAELSVADKYMKAYEQFDVEAMDRYYTAQTIFIDPTSEIWGRHALNIRGKKNILQKMRSFFSQYDEAFASYNVKEKYASAGHTIYTGKVKYSFLKAGQLTTACLRISTIISVQDDKVVEHRDYVDYDNLDASIVAGDQGCH